MAGRNKPPVHASSILHSLCEASFPCSLEEEEEPLYAVADLHGDLGQALAALRLVGLADATGSWTGGKATLVQTGDLLDRGPDSLALVSLFERLKVAAL